MPGDLHHKFEGPPGDPEPDFDRIGARRHPLVAEVRRRLDRVMPDLEGPVIVAVSGGADSTALALAMASIASTFAIGRRPVDPVFAHVHHHLRDAADGDAEFVCELGAKLGIPVHLLDVFPGDRPGNLAANARHDRYAALGRLAATVRAGAVMVGHHAEDQLETILMHLGRGCALGGLEGMPWVGAIPGLPELPIPLVRPLLGSTRVQCQSLCEAAGVTWREDETNADRGKVRTRLREDALPLLEELWPGSAQRVQHLSAQARIARELLEERLHVAFGPPERTSWSREDLCQLDEALIAAGLHRALSHHAAAALDSVDGSMLDQAVQLILDDERRPRSLDWPSGVTVRISSRDVDLVTEST